MAFISAAYGGIGLAFSIVGLSLVVPICFAFKQYFRFLDHIQLTYMYFAILASTNALSLSLVNSWSTFIPNFLTFCTYGDIVCQSGYALSFTICLIGAIIIAFITVLIIRIKNPDIINL